MINSATFSILVCKRNYAKAVSLSKPRAKQNNTLVCGNNDVPGALIPDYQPQKRYKVAGEFDAENRTTYYDMTTAEIS